MRFFYNNITYDDLLRRRCWNCGREFEVSSDHNRARYCSDRCRQAAHRERHRTPLPRQCAHCGAPLPPGTGRVGRPRRYCSHACRQAAYRKRHRRP